MVLCGQLSQSCLITFSAKGTVTPAYETGLALQSVGVIAGGDMTTAAALTKLSYAFIAFFFRLTIDRLLLGQKAPREKIVRRMRESTRGEISSEDRKYSMSDSKLVDAFLDAMRLDEDDTGEGQKEQEIRREFRSLVLPMLLCHAAGEGAPCVTLCFS